MQIRRDNWTGANDTFSVLLNQESGDDSGAHYWRSIALLNLGKELQALADINKYLKSNADDPDAYLVRAQIATKMNNVAAAKVDATAALHRYQVGGDTNGAARAQKFLDELNAPH